MTGEILDLFGGKEDIKRKLIRTVGNPDTRFKEDYLRMLRACRFIALDKNMEIGYNTKLGIGRNLKGILRVSPERIRMEIMKAMTYPIPSKMFKVMQETGLLKLILPELNQTFGVIQNKYHIVLLNRKENYGCRS